MTPTKITRNINAALNRHGYELPADAAEALANTLAEFTSDEETAMFLYALSAAANEQYSVWLASCAPLLE